MKAIDKAHLSRHGLNMMFYAGPETDFEAKTVKRLTRCLRRTRPFGLFY